ncbi:hypothetical protein O181_040971 [Austropuccinia psidii MF-1]|uniref:Uncharacterized protein n=1 Tax=Austropuccinia psidii MF-1 TaxID=1389203 RepID=A0A9Q3DCB3_9BASI|nr:hypothetical protein [Austropuccinia psidii MF-1]
MSILLGSKELTEVCESQLEPGETVTALNKLNKIISKAVNIISSQISPKMFLDSIKIGSTQNSYLLWQKLNKQYASKKPVNQGRVWMNKLSSDAKIHQFSEALMLNEGLIEQPDLVISKLQDYYENSESQSTEVNAPKSSALVSESMHPYKITHYCANGRNNPSCTIHSKEEWFSKNPYLRLCLFNNRKLSKNKNASDHLSTTQALVTVANHPQEEFIIDCGATHHMFNSETFFSSIVKTLIINDFTGDSESTLQ